MFEIPAGLLALIALILAASYIAQPFFAGRQAGTRQGGQAAGGAERRAELLAERVRIYAELTQLDFEFQTDKLAEEEYQALRQALLAEGVAVLQALDALPPPDDWVEEAVRRAREGSAPRAAAKAKPAAAGLTCPQCAEPVRPVDRFCANCGQPLAAAEPAAPGQEA